MYEENVARGVEWLDVHRPGWCNEIDISRLDVSVCFACVLGQLWGPDTVDMNTEKRFDEMKSLGFALDVDIDEVGMAAYKHLTSAWIAEISRRRNVDKLMAEGTSKETVFAA